MGGGHYTATARHHEDGRWYTYNDADVEPVDAGAVVSADNYILFFEQERAAPPRRQTLSLLRRTGRLPPPSSRRPFVSARLEHVERAGTQRLTQ